MACQSCKQKQLAQQQSLQSKQYGVVHFNSDPDGATIYIDGVILVNEHTGEILRTPTSAPLLEGRRDFIFRVPGYSDASGYVDVIPNTTVYISRRLS